MNPVSAHPVAPPAVFFGFSFRHHGPHTAFHGLKRELARDQTVVDITTPWPRWTPAWLEWRLTWRWLEAGEWRLYPYFRGRKPRVIHYYFPENTMRRAHLWRGPHHLVATCHQPAERMRVRMEAGQDTEFLAGLRACNVIVVQTRHDQEPYRALFPGVPVRHVPLGVDTDFFRPAHAGSSGSKELRVLTVGSWLRDYACWAAVVRELARRIPAARFTVVANPDTLAEARQHLGPDVARVTYLSGISDEALRTAFQEASLMFLPLRAAMANDAILEALACGTPVVTSDLEATRDYLGEAGVFVRDNDVAAFAEAVINLWNNPGQASGLAAAGRARAEAHYAWAEIARQYRLIYAEVAGASGVASPRCLT